MHKHHDQVCDMPGCGDNARLPAHEAVHHPAHYGGADNVYEVVKVLAAWGLQGDALIWNAVKYLARAGRKDPAKFIEDLGKAGWYIDERIKSRQTFAERLAYLRAAHERVGKEIEALTRVIVEK